MSHLTFPRRLEPASTLSSSGAVNVLVPFIPLPNENDPRSLAGLQNPKSDIFNTTSVLFAG